MRLGSGTHEPLVAEAARAHRLRPVLLVTFDVPVTGEAATLAVDAAVENGQPLLIANIVGGQYLPVPGAPVPASVVREDVDESLRAPASLAASLGVATERLRVLTPRPLTALLELVAERTPGLVVLGADPSRIRRKRLEKARRSLHERTTCLVWP